MNMEILKVISLLMAYPEQTTVDNYELMREVIVADKNIDDSNKLLLTNFIDRLVKQDLLDVQEQYLDLFGRGSSTSLLLFEHVHGQSRDRGQAMVDLLDRYQQKGFELSAKELPDYIPLFLEFLAHCETEQSLEWLNEINHILAVLEERIHTRGSHYSDLMTVLLSMVDEVEGRNELKAKIAAEEADHTAEAMDKVWEEESVRFAATDAGCSQNNSTLTSETYSEEVDIKWMDAMAPEKQAAKEQTSKNQSSQNQSVGG